MQEQCAGKEIFKSLNIRITKQRQIMLDSILAFQKPFTANDIYESLLQQDNIDLVTLYRFINTLVSKGLLRLITESEGTQFFEMACQHNPLHPHFICNSCHHITCLAQLSVDDYLRISGYAPGTQTKDLKIILGGICENCKTQ